MTPLRGVARRTPRPPAHVVAGALYLAGMVAIAALAAWPIYRSGSFVLVVVASAITGAGIAVAALLRGWGGWLTSAVTAGTAIVLGMLLAPPSRLADPSGLPAGFVDVLMGAVTGWKDLVTVELPVGSYRNLLVPAIVVFLVGTVLGLRLAWLRGRLSVFAAVAALTMVFFGLAFGRPVTSGPLRVGAWDIPAPLETLTGAMGLLISLAWLAWRSQDERRGALQRAAETTGVRVSRRRSASDARRGLLAGGMVAAAVLAAALTAPAVAQGGTREVLRSGIGPDLVVTRATSPLSEYRSLFAEEANDAVLFRVESDGAAPDRIRLATLTDYDGEVYRALDAGASVADARFTRVPAALAAGPGAELTARITIESLAGIWMPTAGRIRSVSFEGPDAAALADSFYYSQDSVAAVQTARGGVRRGDTYVVSAVVPDAPALSGIRAPGVERDVEAPESLVRWLENQAVSADGAGLADAVSRLRERGYLSHALAVGADGTAAWTRELGDYTFQPSAAGHSLARVDALFQQLLERESEAEAPGASTSLVAAIDDDEQFAVAAALIAQELGFPARVVVGARLDAGASGLPACDAGECRGADLAAWIEVQSSGGDWVSVDATPQHAEPVDTQVRQQRDPENVTEVRPETAEEVTPPEPEQRDSVADETLERAPTDLSALWAVLRFGGVGLLALALVIGPFLIVVAAKAARRRARRTNEDTASRIVGGWDEYVDSAVDHGRPPPQAQTRAELASIYATPRAAALATTADRAVFSDAKLSRRQSDEFWAIVDAERLRLAAEAPLWRRAAAAVSLKSFTRHLSPGSRRERAPSAVRSERRTRRRPGDDASAP